MTYRPPYFRVDERAQLLPLIAAYPLATLVTTHDNEIDLTHLPLLAREDGGDLWLEGHIARANDQWRYEPIASVATFMIARHYISPSWYATKKTNPRIVPTYDYVTIEARGPVRFLHEEAWLREVVQRLTEAQEPAVGGTWSLDDAPADYIDTQLKAIVGVQMRVERLIGTFKLNQNHPRENIEGVVAALDALDSPESQRLRGFMDSTST